MKTAFILTILLAVWVLATGDNATSEGTSSYGSSGSGSPRITAQYCRTYAKKASLIGVAQSKSEAMEIAGGDNRLRNLATSDWGKLVVIHNGYDYATKKAAEALISESGLLATCLQKLT